MDALNDMKASIEQGYVPILYERFFWRRYPIFSTLIAWSKANWKRRIRRTPLRRSPAVRNAMGNHPIQLLMLLTMVERQLKKKRFLGEFVTTMLA